MEDNNASVTFLFALFFAMLGLFFSSITFILISFALSIIGWFGIEKGMLIIMFSVIIYKFSEFTVTLSNTTMLTDFAMDVAIVVIFIILSFIFLPWIVLHVIGIESLK